MEIEGNIRKMRAALSKNVEYMLPVGNGFLNMNEQIGNRITLTYLGEIHCIKCGRKTSKSFSQGYCYPCFISAPETEECVLHPELCRAHEGVARDMDYAEKHCLSEHVVYLSITSDLKVGVTRSSQVPVRWIDQGAVRAIELVRTPNRYIAGKTEHALKEYLKDKTNWRAMLKNEIRYDGDLVDDKYRVLGLLPPELSAYRSKNDEISSITYPVKHYPDKLHSLNLDKTPEYEGHLIGIKGQYLLFDDNSVINIRKYGGYKLRVKAAD